MSGYNKEVAASVLTLALVQFITTRLSTDITEQECDDLNSLVLKFLSEFVSKP